MSTQSLIDLLPMHHLLSAEESYLNLLLIALPSQQLIEGYGGKIDADKLRQTFFFI
jgi:hypothetical protein